MTCLLLLLPCAPAQVCCGTWGCLITICGGSSLLLRRITFSAPAAAFDLQVCCGTWGCCCIIMWWHFHVDMSSHPNCPCCCPMHLQVCCGTWGCCDSDVCFNNATTGNQPFCGAGPRCTISGGTTPAEGAGPMGLCPVNTDCVNVTLPTTVSKYATHAAASFVLICSVLKVVSIVHAGGVRNGCS
jgi:hypothetical protein